MKKSLLTILCLLVIRLQAAPIEPTEPVGQRFGMSLLEVLDSIHKEGVYSYYDYTKITDSAEDEVHVRFEDSNNGRLLTYHFLRGKCSFAKLVLPLTELDSLVRVYDHRFTSSGKQIWRTPYGRASVSVAIGAESMRNDGKPHLLVTFTTLK